MGVSVGVSWMDLRFSVNESSGYRKKSVMYCNAVERKVEDDGEEKKESEKRKKTS